MSQDNGAHVEDGATTDASLASRAKNPKKNSPKWWLIALAVVVVVAVIAGAAFAFGGKKDSKNAASSGTYADAVTIGLKLAPTNLDIRNTDFPEVGFQLGGTALGCGHLHCALLSLSLYR